MVQAHVVVLEVAGLILRSRGGGGAYCAFHCLYPIRENTILLQSDATATTAHISVVTIQGQLLFEGSYCLRVATV